MNKYNLGDKVWLMFDNTIVNYTVDSIGYDYDNITIIYSLKEHLDNYIESQLFKTKQELLDSL